MLRPRPHLISLSVSFSVPVTPARLPTGPVYALDWCKSPAPGQSLRPRSAFRLGIASLTDDYRNRIAIVGLQDERVLVEDDYTEYPDFVTLVEAQHGYPATRLQWQPSTANSFAWSQKSANAELLATTGDALRVWEYSSDGTGNVSAYVGRQGSGGGHKLTLKTALSGVSTRFEKLGWFIVVLVLLDLRRTGLHLRVSYATVDCVSASFSFQHWYMRYFPFYS